MTGVASTSETTVTPRTYLFALTDGGGTVPPELGVARRLVDRGHRVTVLADESLADQVRSTGAMFVPCLWSPAEAFRDYELRTPTSLARGIADYMFTGPAPAQARDTTVALDAVRPDLLVTSSFALGAMIAAEALGCPFDVLLPNSYPLPATGMPPFGSGLSPVHGPLGRLRDETMTALGARMIDRYALEKINAVRADYGLGPVAHMWDQIHHARRQLVLTSRAFDFPATLPHNARYVGPILDDPAWAAEEEWTAPAGDNPLVLVAMSSTFQNQVDCLQRVVDALGSLPVRGLVTTGPTVPADALRAPANVTVVDSAPHREVMRHASLVVTHGGHGTVIKALAAGLPLVILHHGRDQADNAARVTARGAGVAVSRRAPAQRIARGVTTVLGTDDYRKAAEALGQAIRHDAAGTTLIDELETLIPAPGRTTPSGS
ncbi:MULTISPECIES: glycosyltransferase [Cryobacterium]|uniref:glycosyltransferase n=1 Tax=Cryobacterium TaxID=69578 RepID=UPI000CD41AD7|nr:MULTISPECIES: glycosyltransferase [Cryobacterium]POH69970.1 glycosyltransferase [Cryobacterium zongtaii]TFC42981.1 glycosyltransferase [Cryobacterium sp. TMN-39-2]